MRIISGKYRNKRLIAPEGRSTRPTSEKVRESVFNILNSHGYTGGQVLDLFAGTGALGIEALSRGAERAVFVEKNPAAAVIVRKNLANVGANMPVYNTDWKVAVRKLVGRRFDIIFLDPPYALGIENELLDAVKKADLLDDDGCIVLEHSSNVNDIDFGDFEADTRVYSDTSVTFLRKKKKRVCVFPGSFNPFTLGHRDVAEEGLRLFDEVIVAVADITYKDDAPSAEIRATIAEKSLDGLNGIRVECFKGMLTDYLAEIGCKELLRGIRDEKDEEYEKGLLEFYRKTDSEIKTTYVKAIRPYISSRQTKIILGSAPEELKNYVSENAIADIIKYYGK